MTRRRIWTIAVTGIVGMVVGMVCSEQAGGSPLGAHSEVVSSLGFLAFAIVFGYLQGHGDGVVDGFHLGLDDMSEDLVRAETAVERLAELLDAARVDVEDAIAIGARTDAGEGLQYLRSVLDDGSLSIRQYNRARAGLPFDVTPCPAAEAGATASMREERR